MAQSTSLAEHYRRHRRAMTLALELHCTPAEAQAELDRRAARAAWEATRQRLEVRMAAGPRAGAIAAPAEPRDEPWMMRD